MHFAMICPDAAMSVPRLFPDFDGDAYEPHPGEAA
jgi:hypothetical protein